MIQTAGETDRQISRYTYAEREREREREREGLIGRWIDRERGENICRRPYSS